MVVLSSSDAATATATTAKPTNAAVDTAIPPTASPPPAAPAPAPAPLPADDSCATAGNAVNATTDNVANNFFILDFPLIWVASKCTLNHLSNIFKYRAEMLLRKYSEMNFYVNCLFISSPAW